MCRKWRTVVPVFYCSEEFILKDAIERGYLQIVKWMCKNGSKLDSDMFVPAITFGRVDIVKWLIKKDCHTKIGIFELAVEYGNIEILDCLWEVCSTSCDSDIYAYSDREDVKIWLRNKGFPFEREI